MRVGVGGEKERRRKGGREKQHRSRFIVLSSSTTTMWTASVPDLQRRRASGDSNLDVSPAASP